MDAQTAVVPTIFVTGPVRSGKSRFAERLALERGAEVVYVATARADPGDAEWSARIAHHAARRPAHWRTLETASEDAPSLAALVRETASGVTLVIDSLGTWLAERMSRRLAAMGGDNFPAAFEVTALEEEASDVVAALLATEAYAIVVGEEVGWGLVPPYPSGRVFRDVLGRAQQRLAAGAAAAYLVVSGFALDLRANGTPVD